MPTDEEIRRAKDYILLRLSAERLAVSSLDSAILSAARRIIDIASRYGIPPEKFRFSANPQLHAEVNAVLATLREAVAARIEELDTFEDEDDTFVAPALTQETNGKTFHERLAEYVARWGYELEATIAAAGLEGIKDNAEILRGVREYIGNTYDNPWIIGHLGEGDAVRLQSIPHYGKGKPIASHTALAMLLTTTIAAGWMQNWARINAGKRGYYVFRGSSYPCEICDEQVGFLHDVNDLDGLPPYHPHCVCYAVYTDQI